MTWAGATPGQTVRALLDGEHAAEAAPVAGQGWCSICRGAGYVP
jgi:hypothetical protein